MPDIQITNETLDKLQKLRLEISASLDIPVLGKLFEYLSTERETMDKDLMKRMDTVRVLMAEDGYAIYRKILIDMRILEAPK